MLGKYSLDEIKELSLALQKKEIQTLSKKEFRQSRIIFIKQDNKMLGDMNPSSVIQKLTKIQFNPLNKFRLYIISSKNPATVKDVSSKDSLEFSYLTYKGFCLAKELEGEKISLVENLLRKYRLPTDLWENQSFQLFSWETQIFEIDKEIVKEL